MTEKIPGAGCTGDGLGFDTSLLNGSSTTRDCQNVQDRAATAFSEFMLAQLRCASARTRLIVCEIDAIGTALKGNFITADDAVAWLAELGVNFTVPSSLEAA